MSDEKGKSSIRISQPGGDQAGSAGPGVDPAAAAAAAANAGGKAESASRILSRLGMGASTSPEASEYIKKLSTGLRESITSLTGQDIGEVKILPVPCEHANIHRVTVNNGGKEIHILMAFSDTYQPPVDAPFTAPSRYLAETAKALFAAGIHIATTVTVPPEGYAHVSRMVRHLSSTFLSLMNPEMFQISLQSLQQDRFKIVTRKSDVKRIIEEWHPTGVVPPTDIGFAVFTNPTNREESPKLLLAIGAYTDFVSTSPTGQGYAGVPQAAVPVTVITSIVAPAPSLSLAILGITLAADAFMRRRLWIDQFTDFSQDAPNIGNLIMDAEGKPFRVNDMMTLSEFVETRLAKPGLLAIDIADGAPRIPGLEKICADMVNEDVARFLGRPVEEISCGISAGHHPQYMGAFGNGVDTRNANYLSLCAENPSAVAQYAPFLVRNTNPEFTLKSLAELFNSTTIHPLYTNNRTILNGPFLNLVTSMTVPFLNVVWESDAGAINNVGALPGGEVATYGTSALYGGQYSGAATGMQQMVYGV